MPVTFSTKITEDGTILLPNAQKALAGKVATITIDIPTESTRARVMKFAGVFKDMTDEELGLDDWEERRGRLVEKETNGADSRKRK